MQTGDIVLIRNGERIILELAPEPSQCEGDLFTRYSAATMLETGDEIRSMGEALRPGIAIRFQNAIMATHPQTGALYIFGARAEARVERGEL